MRADVLIASAGDPLEAVDLDRLPVPPGAIVWTEGGHGGRFAAANGRSGRWDPAPLPGPPVDSYGCGDSFAAGLTVGLARGLDLERRWRPAPAAARTASRARALAAQLDERGQRTLALTQADGVGRFAPWMRVAIADRIGAGGDRGARGRCTRPRRAGARSSSREVLGPRPAAARSRCAPDGGLIWQVQGDLRPGAAARRSSTRSRSSSRRMGRRGRSARTASSPSRSSTT